MTKQTKKPSAPNYVTAVPKQDIPVGSIVFAAIASTLLPFALLVLYFLFDGTLGGSDFSGDNSLLVFFGIIFAITVLPGIVVTLLVLPKLKK